MPSWLVRALARRLPTLSPTQREALEAGTIWADGQLFPGRPDFPRLPGTPSPSLGEWERAFLDGPVEVWPPSDRPTTPPGA